MKTGITSRAGLLVTVLAAGAGLWSAVPTRAHALVVRNADPSAEEVMAEAAKAMGGQEAIDKIKTLRSVSSMSVQGMDVMMETWWSRAGGRMTKTMMPMGEMTMTSDGTIGWMRAPMGAFRLLSAAQTEDLRQQAGMFMNMLDPRARVRESIASIENAGKQPFGGKECWALRYTRKDGIKGAMFFDAATHLPVGFESVEMRGEEELTSRASFNDWKAVEGVQFPHTVTMESSLQAGAAMALKVTTIEINTLDDKAFAAPVEVQALVNPAASQPASAPAVKEITLDDLTPEQRETAAKVLIGMKKAPDLDAMKMMLQRVESFVSVVPADEQLPIKYAIQEMKKVIAKLDG